MFKKLRNYLQNKGLCYSFQSKSSKVVVSICSDLNAARIETPFFNKLVDAEGGDFSSLLPALTEAYKSAQDAGDQTVMDEIHSIRRTLSKA